MPLISETFVVDDVGVAVWELLGDRDSVPGAVEEERGEAVPELLSFFFDDLFESFALDNWSCYNMLANPIKEIRGYRVARESYHSLSKPLHGVFRMRTSDGAYTVPKLSVDVIIDRRYRNHRRSSLSAHNLDSVTRTVDIEMRGEQMYEYTVRRSCCPATSLTMSW